MAYQSRLETSLEIYATCPQSREVAHKDFLRRAVETAQWSEAAGCTGMLLYADNGLVDPWLVAEAVLHRTERLCPLVAVQPLYLHPYAAAKMVASYAALHQRRVCLNMIAGGFRGDLAALGDFTPHDERYERLTEYTLILQSLLASPGPVTFEGRHYTVRNLRLTPPVPPELMPGILMSGSSEAGMAAAQAVGATGITYPRPPAEEADVDGTFPRRGVRLGLIARADAAEAWRVARQRFPVDCRGLATHKLAMATSDSVWHRQLSERAASPEGDDSPYWLWPFQTYKTFCPYLVGSFEQVADMLAAYIAKGYRTYILDIPRGPEDLATARQAFARATAGTVLALEG